MPPNFTRAELLLAATSLVSSAPIPSKPSFANALLSKRSTTESSLELTVVDGVEKLNDDETLAAEEESERPNDIEVGCAMGDEVGEYPAGSENGVYELTATEKYCSSCRKPTGSDLCISSS
jgi:hypothetical protein